MNIAPFESEYPSAELPALTGTPLTHGELDTRSSSRDRWVLAQRAQQNVVMEAVHGFYFAKRFSEGTNGFTGWTNNSARGAVESLNGYLWQAAVVNIAKVNDSVHILRAASLQGVLHSMEKALESSSDVGSRSEISKLNALRSSINPEVQPSLKYARYVRNKWASHPTVDRDFDSWGDADEYLQVPLLEDALARLVRAHQEAADLASSSLTLKPLFSVPRPETELVDTPDGTITQIPMTVAWNNVTVLAELMRDTAGREASGLIDQLTSPPGYGSADDTDWSPTSEHSKVRSEIDRKIRAAQRSTD